MTLKQMTLALTMVLTLAISQAAMAVPVTPLDSSLFNFKYELAVQPSSQDEDGNATSDWFAGVSGGLTEPVADNSGFVTSNHGVSPNQILFRTDFGGSLTRATVTGDLTMEISVQLAGGDQDAGDVGAFGIALQSPGQGQSLRLNVDEDNVSFNGNGASAIATGDNTDMQHIYRVAFEGPNNYWLWRDGQLLNDDINTPFVGSNGSFNNNGAWFLGDFTGSLSGEWTVDYIRVTQGAFAPGVPEPGTAALLLLSAGAMMRRRRKTSSCA